MVVDDSRMVHLQMHKLLENTEYEVAGDCKSGKEAVSKYEEIQPDIVTMDIIMPGMDGLETARTILENHPEAKIVMLSSLAYEDPVNEAKSIGAKGFIYKPFKQEDVLGILDKAMEE